MEFIASSPLNPTNMNLLMQAEDIRLGNRCRGLLIAAANENDNVKGIADYVCDGTADDLQFQAAFDAIASAGTGYIRLTPGDYFISAQVGWDFGKLGVVGAPGGLSRIYLADNANCQMFGFDKAVDDAYAVFDSIYFAGNKDNNTSGSIINNQIGVGFLKDIYFTKCAAFNFAGVAIDLKQAWGAVVFECIIEECDGGAIHIGGGNSARIINNKFLAIPNHVIQVGDPGSPSKIIIMGNELNPNADGYAGLYIAAGAYLSIVGNGFYDQTGQNTYGIMSDGSFNYSNICGNIFHASHSSGDRMVNGILLDGWSSSRNTIAGNTFHSNISGAPIVDNSNAGNFIGVNAGIDNLKKKEFGYFGKTATSGAAVYLRGWDCDDTTNEYIAFSLVVPQDILKNETIDIKFRCCPQATQTGGDQKVIAFDGALNIQGATGVIGAQTNISDVSVTLGVDEVLRTTSEVTWHTFAGGVLSAGDALSITLQRDAANASDTCVGDVMIFASPWLEYKGGQWAL